MSKIIRVENHLELGIFRRQAPQHVPAAVGRAVVRNDNLVIVLRITLEHGAQTVVQFLKVALFVITASYNGYGFHGNYY